MNDWLTIPDGKATGCLPRCSSPGEYAPIFGERIMVVDSREWDRILQDREASGETLNGRGDVRKIKDQDGIGSCFPAGTLIRMKDGSEKPIEQIRLLDEVLTAECRIGRVTQTMVRDHHGPICRLCINGSHHVRMTPEHPVLTSYGYVKASELEKNALVAFPRYLPSGQKIIQTLDHVWSKRHTGSRRTMVSKAGSVKVLEIPGKRAVSITRHELPDIIHLTHGFGRIVGLFLAEGCTSHGKVTWTFAKHEKDTLAAELIELFRTELGVTAHLQIRGNNTVKVNVYGIKWVALFDSLCSRLSSGKFMHGDLTDGPREFLEGVLTGWTDGDGIGPNRLGGGTVSHALAMGMFDIANGLGSMPGMRYRVPKLSRGVKSRKPVWTIEWGHGTLRQDTDYRKYQTDKHVWRRLESVEYEDFTGPVFNLEVEGDHSYVAEGIGVHNCATESTAQAIEVTMVRSGQPWEELNPWSIYRVTSDGRDAGSNIDRNLQFARDVGVLPVKFFPRYDSSGRVVNRWNARPPAGWEEIAAEYRIDEWYDCTTTADIGTALLLGFAVVIGWSGHSELLVDLLPGQKALVANSWGTQWGDGGFHVESLARVNFAYGAFAVRTNRERGT